MGKCAKVKRPCNFCLQPVTKKTGLKCHGACKKWAHFVCLNYSPGKIQDVKRGIITVMCPCPGCATTQPKEFLTNPPFSCTNPTCPANNQPRCESHECPANTDSGILADNQSHYESYGYPTDTDSVFSAPIMHQCPSGIKLQMTPSSDSSGSCPPHPCGPEAPCASSESSAIISLPCPITKMNCQSGNVKKTKSCSCASKDSDSKMHLFKTSSEMNMPSTNSMYVTMQEMCNTVGQLSTQLKQLMCKMMDTPNT